MLLNNNSNTNETKTAITHGIPVWQRVYRQLELHKIKNITSYEVNGNLFIVVPLEEKSV